MKSRTEPLALEEAAVAVLMGGISSEREVSLRSGQAVAAALQGRSRSVIAVEIEADGRWRVGSEALDPAHALCALERIDLFFLGLHGAGGEDGSLQGLFESCDRAYTGSGVCSSALAMDKVFARCVAEKAGLRVARALCLTADAGSPAAPALLTRLEQVRSPAGWSVKPRCGGSSVATALVSEHDALLQAIEGVFELGEDCLVEEWVRGIEFTCPVLEIEAGVPLSLSAVEIRPAAGRFFDFQQKYSADGATEFCPPRSGDARVWAELARCGLLAHQALGCSGYSRTDVIVPHESPQGSLGSPVYLETNTLPGLTARSLLPQAAAQAGLDFPALCATIARAGLAQRGRRGRTLARA